MKTAIILLVVAVLAGCGTPRTINGKHHDTVGLLSDESERDPCVRYKTIVGNAVWGTILFGTVAAPVYFFGFSLYEPVGAKSCDKGTT